MPTKFRYTLTYQSQEYVLNFAPNGWDSETIGNYTRSREFFGLIRAFTLPLRFVKDGAEILRAAFLTGGVEAGVNIKIERRKRLWSYETIYLGQIDFSTYEYNGIEVSVNLMDIGIGADIKAKANTTYEFPLIGNDVVNMVLPGVKFNDALTWSFSPTITSSLFVEKKYIPAQDLITQSKSGFIQGFNVYQTNADDNSDFSGHVFIRNTRNQAISVRLFGKIKGYVVNAGGFPTNVNVSMDFHRLSDKAAIYNLVYVAGPWGIGQIKQYEKDIDFTVTIQPGEAFYTYNKTGTSSATAITNVIQEGELRAEYISVSDPSNCKGIKPFDLFKRLILRVSPSNIVNSSLLTSDWANLIFTSGSAVRELSDAKIKISLNDFFQTFNSIDNVGLGSDEGFLRVEKASYFARPAMIMDIGNVDRCTVTVAEDFIGSKATLGYHSKTTNEPDGREGFNAKQEWGLPITRINNELDWLAPVIADQYELENMRVQFNVKKEATSDANSDNDTFIVHCNPMNVENNYIPILGSQLEAVTGLTQPLSAYNLLISPKRNLLRHEGYLRSILDLQDGRSIEFASADKNSAISSTYNGAIVVENQSINVSSLNGKYFRPYLFTINAKMPIDAMKMLDSTPFGYIQFNFNDIVCKGYIMDVGVDLGGNSAQELTLLATQDSLLP